MDCSCGSAECTTCLKDAATQTDCRCFTCRGLSYRKCSLCGFQIPAIYFSEEALHLDKKPDTCRCFLPAVQEAITSFESQVSGGRESVSVLTSTPIIQRSNEGIPSKSLWLERQVEPCSQIKTTELSSKLTTTFELSSKTEKDISLTENLAGISNYDLVSAGNETEKRNVLQRRSEASSVNKCLEEEHREGNEYTEEDGNSNDCTEEDKSIDEYTERDKNIDECTEEYEYTEENENSNEYTEEDENSNEYTEEDENSNEYTEEDGNSNKYTEDVGKSIEYADVIDGSNRECLEGGKGSRNERIEEEEINKDGFEEEEEDRNSDEYLKEVKDGKYIGESIEEVEDRNIRERIEEVEDKNISESIEDEDNRYSNEHLEKKKHEPNNENMEEERISIPNTADRNEKGNKDKDINVKDNVEKINEIQNNEITNPSTGTVNRHPHQRRDGAAPFYPPEDGFRLACLPFPPHQTPFPRCYQGPFSRNYKAPFSKNYQKQFPLISQNPRMIVSPRLPKFRNPSQLSSRRPIAPQNSTIGARQKVEGWLKTQNFESHSSDEQPQIPTASNFRRESNNSDQKDSLASNKRKYQKSPKPYKGNNPNSG